MNENILHDTIKDKPEVNGTVMQKLKVIEDVVNGETPTKQMSLFEMVSYLSWVYQFDKAPEDYVLDLSNKVVAMVAQQVVDSDEPTI